MMMRRLTAVLSLLTALPTSVGAYSDVAEGRTLRLTKADCAWLVKHQPAPDVAYRPGADVRGQAVVPADLESHPLHPPGTIEIPITVDLQERFGLPADSTLFEAEAKVGQVEVEGDRITFNGRPLADSEVLALAEACRHPTPDQP